MHRIETLHRERFVHRDIKPGNFGIGGSGQQIYIFGKFDICACKFGLLNRIMWFFAWFSFQILAIAKNTADRENIFQRVMPRHMARELHGTCLLTLIAISISPDVTTWRQSVSCWCHFWEAICHGMRFVITSNRLIRAKLSAWNKISISMLVNHLPSKFWIGSFLNLILFLFPIGRNSVRDTHLKWLTTSNTSEMSLSSTRGQIIHCCANYSGLPSLTWGRRKIKISIGQLNKKTQIVWTNSIICNVYDARVGATTCAMKKPECFWNVSIHIYR